MNFLQNYFIQKRQIIEKKETKEIALKLNLNKKQLCKAYKNQQKSPFCLKLAELKQQNIKLCFKYQKQNKIRG